MQRQTADVTLIVPTRHESANIQRLLGRVEATMGSLRVDWQVLFVDDSDDETPEVIRELRNSGHPVLLLHRPGDQRVGGLAGALAQGLRAVDSRVIAVMDADLQHPPEALTKLLPPLLDGSADIAVGSRYLPGGTFEGLDGPWRRLVSKGSRTLVWGVFPETRKVSDPGSGFFGLRHDVLDHVDLRPEGFKMLLEVLVRGRWDKAHEVPYNFAGRMYGASNATFYEGLRFLRHVGRLWTGTRTKVRLGHQEPLADVLIEDGFGADATERTPLLVKTRAFVVERDLSVRGA